MSDLYNAGIIAGATSRSIRFVLRKTADNTEQTGKVAADMTLSYWRQGSTRTSITASDLAAVNSAFSSGGVKEVDSTNQPGLYRLDLPDAAIAASADWVVISVKVTGCYSYHESFPLTANAEQTGDAYARLGAPVGASISADVAGVPAAALDLSAGVETGLTLRQALRLIVAAAAGKVSGAGTSTVVIRNPGDTKNRVSATVDASGNRSAITTDVT